MVQILKERVRSRIVEAAESQFAKAGFKHATIGGIAQEAGVASGTIYKYFSNKKTLFYSIVTDEFVNEFSRLTRSRVETFAQSEKVDPGKSYTEGEAGELLRFWIRNRRRAIILLARSDGTKYEGFAQRYIQDMAAQAISQARAQYPRMELTSLLEFLLHKALTDSVRGVVSILEQFDDEKDILEAFEASTAYQLGGLGALMEWNCKQRRS